MWICDYCDVIIFSDEVPQHPRHKNYLRKADYNESRNHLKERYKR